MTRPNVKSCFQCLALAGSFLMGLLVACACVYFAADAGDSEPAVVTVNSSPAGGAIVEAPSAVPLSALLMKSPGFVGIGSAECPPTLVDLPDLVAAERGHACNAWPASFADQNLRLRI